MYIYIIQYTMVYTRHIYCGIYEWYMTYIIRCMIYTIHYIPRYISSVYIMPYGMICTMVYIKDYIS